MKFYRFLPFEIGYVFNFTDTKPVKHRISFLIIICYHSLGLNGRFAKSSSCYLVCLWSTGVALENWNKTIIREGIKLDYALCQSMMQSKVKVTCFEP